jgi:hypothetical protein
MSNLETIKMMSEYYGKDMTKNQIKIYLNTLKDIPCELLELATEHLIKNGCPFMPKVAELRRAAEIVRREGKYEPVDPLKLIPGAAQTEEDLDERYGTREEHREIFRVFASSGAAKCAVCREALDED